jgi:hypothetical protein
MQNSLKLKLNEVEKFEDRLLNTLELQIQKILFLQKQKRKTG